MLIKIREYFLNGEELSLNSDNSLNHELGVNLRILSVTWILLVQKVTSWLQV